MLTELVKHLFPRLVRESDLRLGIDWSAFY